MTEKTQLIHSTQDKLPMLEGLRAIMAFNVVICHFICTYYPQMYYLPYAQEIGGKLSLFATTPLSALVNGNIAVQYFFVLTGFLVGKTFFTKTIYAEDIPVRTIKRYMRLLPVICLATVFSFLTMVLGLQRHLEFANLVKNPGFLRDICDFTPTIVSLLRNIFVWPFSEQGSIYVGPFWTIRYEFWGYVLSMVICLLFQKRKTRRLEYVVVAVACRFHLDGNYIAFVLGIFVADIMYNTYPSIWKPLFEDWIHRKGAVWCIFFVGLFLASCPMNFTFVHSIFRLIPYLSAGIVRAAGIAMLLFAIFHIPRIEKFLSAPWLLALGTISFEVYAIHWPLMLSLEIWLFSILIKMFSYDVAAIMGFVITVPVIYLSAYIMQLCLRMMKKIKF